MGANSYRMRGVSKGSPCLFMIEGGYIQTADWVSLRRAWSAEPYNLTGQQCVNLHSKVRSSCHKNRKCIKECIVYIVPPCQVPTAVCLQQRLNICLYNVVWHPVPGGCGAIKKNRQKCILFSEAPRISSSIDPSVFILTWLGYRRADGQRTM